MTNLNEQKETFTISNIQNKDGLKKWLDNFSEIEINLTYLDKTISEILVKIHSENLVQELIEQVLEEKFYSGCDQYSLAVCIVLVSKGFSNISMLRSYEILSDRFDEGSLEKAPGSEKYNLDYVPHNFVMVKIAGTNYIFNPKYTSLNDLKLVSEISASYHVDLDETYMVEHHQNSENKSLLFSKVRTMNISGYNFTEFPLYEKDKKGSRKLYKSYINTKFEL